MIRVSIAYVFKVMLDLTTLWIKQMSQLDIESAIIKSKFGSFFLVSNSFFSCVIKSTRFLFFF